MDTDVVGTVVVGFDGKCIFSGSRIDKSLRTLSSQSGILNRQSEKERSYAIGHTYTQGVGGGT